ncbi:MAG: response regulator transcription factor [Ruminococcaceae bacterium]|nr:response regulator transcription factor [Oscillospiraceae bacterium]
MFNVLVVEDDGSLRKLMCAALRQNGYNPLSADNGETALDVLDTEQVDLVIADIMMPVMDGFELTEALRSSGYNMPILIVTAKMDFSDKQKGFMLGADDYMVKPIDVGEMILRVGALLRRAQIAHEHMLTVGSVTLDYNALAVRRGSETETLPKKEFYLLFMLLSYPDVIFTRRQLLDEIWGMEHDVDERTVDVHIRRLRERYEDNPDFEIVTVRGLGYKAVKKA